MGNQQFSRKKPTEECCFSEGVTYNGACVNNNNKKKRKTIWKEIKMSYSCKRKQKKKERLKVSFIESGYNKRNVDSGYNESNRASGVSDSNDNWDYNIDDSNRDSGYNESNRASGVSDSNDNRDYNIDDSNRDSGYNESNRASGVSDSNDNRDYNIDDSNRDSGYNESNRASGVSDSNDNRDYDIDDSNRDSGFDSDSFSKSSYQDKSEDPFSSKIKSFQVDQSFSHSGAMLCISGTPVEHCPHERLLDALILRKYTSESEILKKDFQMIYHSLCRLTDHSSSEEFDKPMDGYEKIDEGDIQHQVKRSSSSNPGSSDLGRSDDNCGDLHLKKNNEKVKNVTKDESVNGEINSVSDKKCQSMSNNYQSLYSPQMRNDDLDFDEILDSDHTDEIFVYDEILDCKSENEEDDTESMKPCNVVSADKTLLQNSQEAEWSCNKHKEKVKYETHCPGPPDTLSLPSQCLSVVISNVSSIPLPGMSPVGTKEETILSLHETSSDSKVRDLSTDDPNGQVMDVHDVEKINCSHDASLDQLEQIESLVRQNPRTLEFREIDIKRSYRLNAPTRKKFTDGKQLKQISVPSDKKRIDSQHGHFGENLKMMLRQTNNQDAVECTSKHKFRIHVQQRTKKMGHVPDMTLSRYTDREQALLEIINHFWSSRACFSGRHLLIGVGLDAYFRQMLTGPRFTLHGSMRFEWLRFRSFWSYPSNAGISVIFLARWGFYATGHSTETRCFSCNVVYRDWDENSNVEEVHRRISPDCIFICQGDSGNVPIGPGGPEIGALEFQNGTTQREPAPETVSETTGVNSESTIDTVPAASSANASTSGAVSGAEANRLPDMISYPLTSITRTLLSGSSSNENSSEGIKNNTSSSNTPQSQKQNSGLQQSAVETTRSGAQGQGQQAAETTQSGAEGQQAAETTQSGAQGQQAAETTQSGTQGQQAAETTQSGAQGQEAAETTRSDAEGQQAAETTQNTLPREQVAETTQSTTPRQQTVETARSGAEAQQAAETTQSGAQGQQAAETTRSGAGGQQAAETTQTTAPRQQAAETTQTTAPGQQAAETTQTTAPRQQAAETTQTTAPRQQAAETTRNTAEQASANQRSDTRERGNSQTIPTNVSSQSEPRFDPLGINFDRPRYPAYSVLQVRVNTFDEWPSNMTQTPRQMAEAGFFAAGYGDYVRCFFCGGGLRNWEAGDDPWVEHARWFTRCAFIRLNKGEKFVRDVRDRHLEREAGITPTPELPQHQIPDLDLPASQSLLRMGYDADTVQKAIDTWRSRVQPGQLPAPELSASLLIDIIEDSDNSSTASGDEDSRPNPVGADNLDTVNTSTENGASGNLRESESMKELQEEYQSLSKMMKCKVCMKEPVAVAFLPCGDLVCCKDCAPAMRICPICKELVKGTVKTFFA